MQKYINYINEFQEGNVIGLKFIKNQLKKHLDSHNEDQTEIEHILDYLYSNPTVDISKIGYKTIAEKANKWNKKLQENVDMSDEVVGVDYNIVLDFGDGFKIVKLLSKKAYQREGKLMSHCVGSYYGKNKDIYSLRDSRNNPHCTMEKDNQIKGKGNGSINPKYIRYVVEFIEHLGMKVRDSEMKNLGYSVCYFPEICLSPLFRERYFYGDIKDCEFSEKVYFEPEEFIKTFNLL